MPVLNADGLPVYDENAVPLEINPAVAGIAGLLGINGAVYGRDLAGDPTERTTDVNVDTAVPQPPLNVRVALLRAITGGAPPAAAHAVIFARNPAKIDRDVIDYKSKAGAALYRQATQSLYDDAKDKFPLDSGDLIGFMDDVSRRAQACGWNLFNMPNGAGDIKNLLKQHGELKLEEIYAHIEPITTLGTAREAQEDEQLYQMIMASLTKEAKNTVSLREEDYKIGDEYSGVLLLKVVVMSSMVDTLATTNLLWQKLTAGMPDIMAGCGNNVKEFNLEIQHLQKKLRARGQDPSSIMPQLFVVYGTCDKQDGKFSRYMEQLTNSYSDGTVTGLDAKSLMDKAASKYEELNEKTEFAGAPKEESVIVTLQTELRTLQSTIENLKKKGPDGGKDPPKGGGGPRSKVPDWMSKSPTDGKLNKVVNDKTYHWCEGNGAHTPRWVRHTPAECRGSEKKKPESILKEEKPKGVSWSTAAMQAMVDDEE